MGISTRAGAIFFHQNDQFLNEPASFSPQQYYSSIKGNTINFPLHCTYYTLFFQCICCVNLHFSSNVNVLNIIAFTFHKFHNHLLQYFEIDKYERVQQSMHGEDQYDGPD